MDKKYDNLFQITETAKVCGISRSTLMRLEEKQLIKPAYVSKESGRRYYDNYNIARILEIQKFKSMGLSNEDIISFYKSGGDISKILLPLEEKLFNLKRSIDELSIRSHKESKTVIEIITLPKVICMVKKAFGKTTKDKYDAMYSFYTECVRNGYLLSDEPLFDIHERNDFLNGYISDDSYPFYVCVPVKKETNNSVVIPSCKALSVLYYGDYENSENCLLIINEELKKRKLKPCGLPRVIGIIAAYSGREISDKKYCSRYVIPIEDNSQESESK